MPGTPVNGEPRPDRHPYAMWDGAYGLGSLSEKERREFEAHLGGCASCREAVAELSGMPALLASLDRDEVAAIDEPASIGSSADARGSDGARSTGLAGGGASLPRNAQLW